MRLNQLFASYDPQAAILRKPYIIAEIGVNHENDMELAQRLIEEAKEGDADAVKFQTYKAESLVVKNSPAYWDLSKEPTKSQFDLFKKHDKFWKNEFEKLKSLCDKTGIEFLSTPFDAESASFLNDFMDVYKISSSDITNKPFIDLICQFGKPVVLSTGASNLDEINDAVAWVEAHGNDLALLHCVLNYPTNDKCANLGMILDLKKEYPDKLIGYSDHTLPGNMKVLELAVLLGAVIVEKHFTHDKSLPGNDHYHAMDKHDLKKFRDNISEVFSILGGFDKKALASEAPARLNARRSLVARRDIPKGKLVMLDDLTYKRPAHGISPKHIRELLNKRALQPISKDEALQWEHFSEA